MAIAAAPFLSMISEADFIVPKLQNVTRHCKAFNTPRNHNGDTVRIMLDWEELREPWDRLRWARFKAGFERANEAAESLGMLPVTYRTYEREPGRPGARNFDHELAIRFAKKFKVSWTWLLTGEGAPDDKPNTELQVAVGQIEQRLKRIVEKDDRDTAVRLINSVLDAYAKAG